jgi:SAM-dependent methyltransferase
MMATVFTDPGAHQRLYADPARLAQRTSALHAAKISGEDAAAAIAGLTVEHRPDARLLAGIGCGRGTTVLRLSQHLPRTLIVGVDQSPALLDAARRRHSEARVGTAAMMCADFHHLPIGDARLDVAVAAFCLYHSTRPAAVVAEIARCLSPGGVAVLATKSADSYRELGVAITTELVIARHGEAHCNVLGVVGGERGCTGLTDLGHRQATQLATRLGPLCRLDHGHADG